ncbi:MAG: hypothetical protein HY647_11200 [Acidobacteria bacterium]|nr:hypothetical protein [Acidobacteriota bacterium]
MTERAADKIKEVFQNRSLPENTLLRIEVETADPEGALELSLKLDTSEPREDDAVETTEGARLVVQKELGQVLGESRLDFQEDSGGFVLEPIREE